MHTSLRPHPSLVSYSLHPLTYSFAGALYRCLVILTIKFRAVWKGLIGDSTGKMPHTAHTENRKKKARRLSVTAGIVFVTMVHHIHSYRWVGVDEDAPPFAPSWIPYLYLNQECRLLFCLRIVCDVTNKKQRREQGLSCRSPLSSVSRGGQKRVCVIPRIFEKSLFSFLGHLPLASASTCRFTFPNKQNSGTFFTAGVCHDYDSARAYLAVLCSRMIEPYWM